MRGQTSFDLGRREFLTATVIPLSGCLSLTNSDDSNESEDDDNPEPASEETHFFELDADPFTLEKKLVTLHDVQWRPLNRRPEDGFVALVENTAREELDRVRVTADFYDDDTQIGSGWAMPEFLQSGEQAQVEIPPDHVDSPDRINRIGMTVRPHRDPITPYNDGEVEITDETFDTSDDRAVVSAELRNTTDEQLSRVYVQVNFYQDGTIVDWRRDAAARLPAGAAAEWEVTASDHVAPTDYRRRVRVQK